MFSEEQKEIRRKRALAWNRAHPERVKQNAKLYVLKNYDLVKENVSRYAAEHREENRARVQDYVKRNPWYWSYAGAKQRCTNPKNPRYQYYGARGIKFELSKSDIAFLWHRDKASRMDQPSIDRIDSNGNYTMQNCRFIEKSENSRKMFSDRWFAEIKEAQTV